MGIKEAFANMSDDFKAKAKNVKTKEEFEALIQEEGIELTPEQADALAGGSLIPHPCPVFNCPIDW